MKRQKSEEHQAEMAARKLRREARSARSIARHAHQQVLAEIDSELEKLQ